MGYGDGIFQIRAAWNWLVLSLQMQYDIFWLKDHSAIMQVSVQDECRPPLKASGYLSHWSLQNSEEGLFATKNLLIKFMSLLILREQTLEYIEILCLQDDGYRRRKKETPIKSFSACLTSQKSAAWGTKKTRIIPLTSKENVFESSTPFICFLLGWIVRDTIDTVVGRLVPISTNKICNCNSYINSWGHKYNTISYWVLWNMFWVYLEHCYLFFTVSLRRPWWGLHAFLFFFSFVPFLFNIFLIFLNLILL